MLTFNCIKSFISTRETRENDRVCVVLLFLFRKEARKKYLMSSLSSSFRPLKMMCVLFLSSFSVSLATYKAFQLFLKRHVLGIFSVRLSLSNFRFRSANREALHSKSSRKKALVLYTHSLFLLKLCRSLFAFSSHAVYTSSCPCG